MKNNDELMELETKIIEMLSESQKTSVEVVGMLEHIKYLIFYGCMKVGK